jgi:uncharacterized protein (TIGR03085 family)
VAVVAEHEYLAHADRLRLCQLMEEVGPDAPTLCEGWTTKDLAAHLVARERRPDSVPGLVAEPFAAWSEKVRASELRRPYRELVDLLRSGPPRWSPLGWPAFDRLGNTHEMFVHYEDVRRARPGWEPRQLAPQDEDDLWRVLGWVARRAFHPAQVGVVLERPDGTSRTVGHRTPTVTLTGPPGELLMYAFGRQEHADVQFHGPPDAVVALQRAPLTW